MAEHSPRTQGDMHSAEPLPPFVASESRAIDMSVIRKKSTPKEIRALITVASLNLAMFGIISYSVGAWFFGERWVESLVGKFDLDDGRFINVYSRQSETHQNVDLRYEVVVNDKVLVPRNASGATFRSGPAEATQPATSRDFSIVPAERGDLIAVTDRTRNDEIVILHDFASNLSWPARDKNEQAGREIGRFLLRRLQCEYPFFNAAEVSRYRPAWVWSPNRSQWLLTLPYSPTNEDEEPATPERKVGTLATSRHGRNGGPLRHEKARDALLGIQVWNSETRRACFITTEYACDDFDEHSTAGWLSNDMVLVSFYSGATYAWKIIGDNPTALPLTVDDAIVARAAELRAAALQKAPRSPTQSTTAIDKQRSASLKDLSW